MATKIMPRYNTMLFGEIFESLDERKQFLQDYSMFTGVIKAENQELLYYLLTAKYGNDPIINKSLTQFYIKVAINIMEHGPIWEKKMEIQSTIRNFTENDLLIGAKQIYNEAYNPNTAPSTDTTEELPYINTQKVNKNKRNKLDAYSMLYDALRRDATEEFIAKFKNCFSPFIIAPCPIIYETEEEEEEN